MPPTIPKTGQLWLTGQLLWVVRDFHPDTNRVQVGFLDDLSRARRGERRRVVGYILDHAQAPFWWGELDSRLLAVHGRLAGEWRPWQVRAAGLEPEPAPA
jgi:hypothetical protein